MAYTIIRSNGTTLTTIPDGNINTSSTSLQLPGRNYPGYGQSLDTNFVRIVENFANTAPPPNPLKGQLWYNTTLNTLNICPADGTSNPATWSVVATTTTAGSASMGNLTLTGNIYANNATISEHITCNTIQGTSATFSANILVDTANVTTGNIGTVRTQVITSGSSSTSGTLTGLWTLTGNISSGNSKPTAIYTDNYYYANGESFNPSGTYTNSNVEAYLTGVWGNGNPYVGTRFAGDIEPNSVSTTYLYGGGNIGGIWTLEDGARIQATYADLAERFAADAIYDTGTVVEIGGEHEITEVQEDLSEEVFGVVSTSAAFTMNGVAGGDDTHPAIAVSGRVPVKVIGKVKKGQRLVSAGRGYARAAKRDEMTAFNVIGRALENKTTEGSGTVLAIVALTK